MKTTTMLRNVLFAAAIPVLSVVSLVVAPSGCGGSESEADAGPPPCDLACRDRTAMRAIRETMKLAYNRTLQGKPVGAHDVAYSCAGSGYAYIYGTATSNAEQGTTEVDLTYEFHQCINENIDDDADETYLVILDGKVTQKGVLAVLPSTPSAVVMRSDGLTVAGQLYNPRVPYFADACRIQMDQNGNHLTARICGRGLGLDL